MPSQYTHKPHNLKVRLRESLRFTSCKYWGAMTSFQTGVNQVTEA